MKMNVCSKCIALVLAFVLLGDSLKAQNTGDDLHGGWRLSSVEKQSLDSGRNVLSKEVIPAESRDILSQIPKLLMVLFVTDDVGEVEYLISPYAEKGGFSAAATGELTFTSDSHSYTYAYEIDGDSLLLSWYDELGLYCYVAFYKKQG